MKDTYQKVTTEADQTFIILTNEDTQLEVR